jgi:hypothetical protein
MRRAFFFFERSMRRLFLIQLKAFKWFCKAEIQQPMNQEADRERRLLAWLSGAIIVKYCVCKPVIFHFLLLPGYQYDNISIRIKHII